MATNTFPGVYPSITDDSFTPLLVSLYRPAMVGVASKGPMNTPTEIQSVVSFQKTFGRPVDGFFLANAIAAVSDFSDGSVVVRVGKQYEPVTDDGASTFLSPSGAVGSNAYKIYTANAKKFSIGDYVRIVEPGKKSTVNAKVDGYLPPGNVTDPNGLQLVNVGGEATTLADTYTAAWVDRSTLPNAASNAESFLDSLVYGDNQYSESAGFVIGDKQSFEFDMTGIVGPQPLTSVVVSSGVATINFSGLPIRLAVGDRVHLDNASSTFSAVNGEVTIATVNNTTQIATAAVPQHYGSELLTGSAPSGGFVTVSVTPGATYHYVHHVTDSLVVNGSTTFSASSDFVAEGNFIRVYMTGVVSDGSLKLISGVPDGTVTVALGADSLTIAILAPGDVIKISQDSHNTTWELMVKEINGGTHVRAFPTNVSETGYQAVSLQDSYTSGLIQKANRETDGTLSKETCLHIIAASAGTWANGDGVATGLFVKVAPGSLSGTKKFLVYDRGTLVETIDNLSSDSGSDDYYPARINGLSATIAILTDNDGNPVGVLNSSPPSNTFKGWNPATFGTINFAILGDASKNYGQGFNGETATSDDYIGTYVESTDSYTGLKAFLMEANTFNITVIAIPGVTDLAVHQEMFEVASKVLATAIIDPPGGINGRQIVDWHNGEGLFQTDRARLDTWHGTFLWNRISIVDPFSNETIFIPTSISLMRQQAYTATHFNPAQAAAGEKRGVITIATGIEYKHVGEDTKQSMYGNGQSVNPTLYDFGKFLIYGNRTLQRAESKLSDLSNAMLVKYLVRQLSLIGRKYVFDPNDPELLIQIRLDMTSFLETQKSGRGIEDYALKADAENNPPAVRNQRAAVVDFNVIPFGAMERLFINATVNSSGATINKVG